MMVFYRAGALFVGLLGSEDLRVGGVDARKTPSSSSLFSTCISGALLCTLPVVVSINDLCVVFLTFFNICELQGTSLERGFK